MTFLEIIGYGGYVVGGIIILASKTKNDNLNDLRLRVEILESERKDAHARDIKNLEVITELRTQVKLYKDLQLDSIAKTNAEMLKVLQDSALIRATEKEGTGVLVHTEESSPLDVKVKE